MKYCCLLVTILLTFSLLKVSAQQSNFHIEGNTFYKSGVVKLYRYGAAESLTIFDSAAMRHGAFLLQGRISEPQFFLLQFGKESKLLYLHADEYISIRQSGNAKGDIQYASKNKDGVNARCCVDIAMDEPMRNSLVFDNIQTTCPEPE